MVGEKAKRLESGFLVTESKNPALYGPGFILVFYRVLITKLIIVPSCSLAIVILAMRWSFSYTRVALSPKFMNSFCSQPFEFISF
jgi:hypothetical protein